MKNSNKNLFIAAAAAGATVLPEFVLDPELVTSTLTILSQVITGIISIWHIIKAVFKKS